MTLVQILIHGLHSGRRLTVFPLIVYDNFHNLLVQHVHVGHFVAGQPIKHVSKSLVALLVFQGVFDIPLCVVEFFVDLVNQKFDCFLNAKAYGESNDNKQNPL